MFVGIEGKNRQSLFGSEVKDLVKVNLIIVCVQVFFVMKNEDLNLCIDNFKNVLNKNDCVLDINMSVNSNVFELVEEDVFK